MDYLQGKKMALFLAGNAQQSVPFRTELAYAHLRLKNKQVALRTIRQNIVGLESNVRPMITEIFPQLSLAELSRSEGLANDINYLISNYFLAGTSFTDAKPS